MVRCDIKPCIAQKAEYNLKIITSIKRFKLSFIHFGVSEGNLFTLLLPAFYLCSECQTNSLIHVVGFYPLLHFLSSQVLLCVPQVDAQDFRSII